VYIENETTIESRNMEANMRTILKEIGRDKDYMVRNGKIRRKMNSRDQRDEIKTIAMRPRGKLYQMIGVDQIRTEAVQGAVVAWCLEYARLVTSEWRQFFIQN
jgi:hypothetical protein